ncbi:NnrU family protein [Profundibacter sp.]|uniref:NnrU family protein n=1 Tax=Profundibacter sp. TaxID=3101071 RepID=UPI003D10BE40
MELLSDWGEFIAAFVVFFVSHSIPTRPAVKSRIVAMIGPVGFTLAYSALSTAILTWIIIAAGRAPYVELWGWEPWQNNIPLTAMYFATLIFTMTLCQPNPLSFGGCNNDRFDPNDPGLIGWIHHPLLVTLLIWSLAHMVPNGDLAHVIVFGLFAGFSLLGMRIINKRARRILGANEWQRLSNTKRSFKITRRGLVRLTLGTALYLALLYLHEPVIGISPLP